MIDQPPLIFNNPSYPSWLAARERERRELDHLREGVRLAKELNDLIDKAQAAIRKYGESR